MLGQTLDRLQGLVPTENIFVITNCEQRDAIMAVCPELLPDNIIGEPEGRDTAAAVGLALLMVKQRDSSGILLMLPADHVIHNVDAFQAVIESGFKVAEENQVLVTIGIRPTMPATGYGYIQKGNIYAQPDGNTYYTVKQFVEKPDLETAKTYVEAGDYFWNAGMFVWSVATIEAAFSTHVTQMLETLRVMERGLSDGIEMNALLAEYYPSLEKISVDYAIMEKATNTVVLVADFDWDDVGEWPAIARHLPADENGNVLLGEAIVLQGSGNIVSGNEQHMIALIGVDDLVVAHTEDATLICSKAHSQNVKAIAQQLKSKDGWSKYC